MDNRTFWIWLQHAFGAGSQKPWSIFNRFAGGVEEFYEGGPSLWNSMSFVSEKESRMLYAFSLQEAEAVLELSEKLGHGAITPEQAEFPEALRNIYAPPAVLYYKGELPDVDSKPSVAVVGARKASERAVNAATTVSYQLALSGATVVSGGALGVDTAALKGAMRGMGKAVSVLPCGLSDGYLIENYLLREKIAETGALVTEYTMNTPVSKGTFQVRNRLISGLACGVMIVEASARSGSLITAKHAKEQDRDVFALPSDGTAATSGNESLILDGAKSVTSADEILCEYAHRFKLGTKPEIAQADDNEESEKVMVSVGASIASSVMSDSAPQGIDDEQIKLLKALGAEPKHISSLEIETGISTARLLSLLTELELMGKIKTHSGRRYSL